LCGAAKEMVMTGGRQVPLFNLMEQWMKGVRFGLVLDPGYCSGRKPTESDLNTDMLEAIYKGLESDINKTAARNFVLFVNNLRDLSASAFIIAFTRFFASGCKMTDVEQQPQDREAVTGFGHAMQVQAFAVVASRLVDGKPDEGDVERDSNRLKARFLRAHEREIPSSQRQNLNEYALR
jgi:hypothetical protein